MLCEPTPDGNIIDVLSECWTPLSQAFLAAFKGRLLAFFSYLRRCGIDTPHATLRARCTGYPTS